MDLKPKIIKANSEEELIAKSAEFAKAGRRVIECNIFEDGIMGKMAYVVPPEGTDPEKWSAQDADAIWITWEKFGRLLIPEKTLIEDGNQMFTVFDQHRSHPMVGYTNSMTRTAGFVCFCQASEGKSLVFVVNMVVAKEIPEELKAFFEPVKSRE